jgi:serine phosphatase RsbU (regulator of sigma subunit)
MGAISPQRYENTPPEKYATFFCSVYDDETGRFIYTNAGHLKPILGARWKGHSAGRRWYGRGPTAGREIRTTR